MERSLSCVQHLTVLTDTLCSFLMLDSGKHICIQLGNWSGHKTYLGWPISPCITGTWPGFEQGFSLCWEALIAHSKHQQHLEASQTSLTLILRASSYGWWQTAGLPHSQVVFVWLLSDFCWASTFICRGVQEEDTSNKCRTGFHRGQNNLLTL